MTSIYGFFGNLQVVYQLFDGSKIIIIDIDNFLVLCDSPMRNITQDLFIIPKLSFSAFHSLFELVQPINLIAILGVLDKYNHPINS